jgi:hypothetical protein
MITFRHMPLLVLPSRTLIRLAAACSFFAAAPAASAQIVLSHTEDASPVPRGVLRVDLTTGWTRFDERFTATGRQTLGGELTTDSLGPRQFPALVPIESSLQTLANDPRMRLSLGRLTTVSDVRIVTTPIVFEYGLTRRLSIGVLVPLVQTRRSISLGVNKDSSGNVGYVPDRSRAAAALANQSVYSSLTRAADSLGKLISNCPGNPSAAGCAAVNANPSDVAAARTQAQQFAAAVKTALGVDTTATIVAPRDGSALATSIDAQRNAINTHLQKYLGAGSGALSGVFTASSAFTYVDLQGAGRTPGFLGGPLGGGVDSLYTANRLRVNGATLGVRYLAFDNFRYDTVATSGLHSRLVVGGAYRFASGFIDTTYSLAVPIDNGAGIEAHSALDVVSGHLAATVVARFMKPFAANVVTPVSGNPETLLPVPGFGLAQRTEGTTFSLDLTPRYLMGDWFSVDGLYGLERTGAPTYVLDASAVPCANCVASSTWFANAGDRTAQRLGFGFRYSTVESTARGKTGFPVEVSFSHLETISGDAGVAKVSRDQIQVRLFLRLRD